MSQHQYKEGQCLWGKIRFKDGEMPAYDRPYLIVNVADHFIEVLNVSSLRGKEKNLLYAKNISINNYDPPFTVPSFVKLDSLTRVNAADCSQMHLMSNGQALDQSELKRIKELLRLLI